MIRVVALMLAIATSVVAGGGSIGTGTTISAIGGGAGTNNYILSLSSTFYGTTNSAGVNAKGTPSYYMDGVNPTYLYARTYSNLVNNQYLTGLVITNINVFSGPITVTKNICVTNTGGSPSMSMVYEVYYTTNQSLASLVDPGWSSSQFTLICDKTTNTYTSTITAPYQTLPTNSWLVIFAKLINPLQITSITLLGGDGKPSSVSVNISGQVLNSTYVSYTAISNNTIPVIRSPTFLASSTANGYRSILTDPTGVYGTNSYNDTAFSLNSETGDMYSIGTLNNDHINTGIISASYFYGNGFNLTDVRWNGSMSVNSISWPNGDSTESGGDAGLGTDYILDNFSSSAYFFRGIYAGNFFFQLKAPAGGQSILEGYTGTTFTICSASTDDASIHLSCYTGDNVNFVDSATVTTDEFQANRLVSTNAPAIFSPDGTKWYIHVDNSGTLSVSTTP